MSLLTLQSYERIIWVCLTIFGGLALKGSTDFVVPLFQSISMFSSFIEKH